MRRNVAMVQRRHYKLASRKGLNTTFILLKKAAMAVCFHSQMWGIVGSLYIQATFAPHHLLLPRRLDAFG